MGFFDKSRLGQLKDMVVKGPMGVFNETAREQMPSATSMNNPDGTMNKEAMEKMQQQGRDAMAKAGNFGMFGRKFIAPDVTQGYQQMMEGAFQRQQVMAEMMDEYVRAKHAATAATPATEAQDPSSKPPNELEPE